MITEAAELAKLLAAQMATMEWTSKKLAEALTEEVQTQAQMAAMPEPSSPPFFPEPREVRVEEQHFFATLAEQENAAEASRLLADALGIERQGGELASEFLTRAASRAEELRKAAGVTWSAYRVKSGRAEIVPVGETDGSAGWSILPGERLDTLLTKLAEHEAV